MFFDRDRLLDLPRPVPPDEPEPSAEARRILEQVAKLRRINAVLLKRLIAYQQRHGIPE